MAAITWDETGKRWYETGIDHGVLYPLVAAQNGTVSYPSGVAWNGLTGWDENPDGAEVQDLWADNIKYATFRTPENHKGNIKAYTYPKEFRPCMGLASPAGADGMTFGQQARAAFGASYRTMKGNDTNENAGYVLHLVYNCTVSPSSMSHSTKNENPDAVEFSWDYESTPTQVTNVSGIEQTSTIELDSTIIPSAKMTAIENILYGNGNTAARLPLPEEVYTTVKGTT